MTIEERAAQAAQYKATGACNCTQAVIKVYIILLRDYIKKKLIY